MKAIESSAVYYANKHLTSVGLPTYDELFFALRAMVEVNKPVLADLPNLSPELKAQKPYAAYLAARDLLSKLDAG
ncbi:hypothetical protein [Burkholderia cenocepacia]|uniref:hypothetical protein n=1 Tax=Burkholderia cenocepacia TaxID=95486 RepID=UPI00264B415D|nr:hypothetical protein [Burkholderia cenocepacia]MDN7458142.1 hypothetical protein [Burkholderia cenocepacia]